MAADLIWCILDDFIQEDCRQIYFVGNLIFHPRTWISITGIAIVGAEQQNIFLRVALLHVHGQWPDGRKGRLLPAAGKVAGIFKGQLISEGYFDVFKSPKKLTKFL